MSSFLIYCGIPVWHLFECLNFLKLSCRGSFESSSAHHRQHFVSPLTILCYLLPCRTLFVFLQQDKLQNFDYFMVVITYDFRDPISAYRILKAINGVLAGGMVIVALIGVSYGFLS